MSFADSLCDRCGQQSPGQLAPILVDDVRKWLCQNCREDSKEKRTRRNPYDAKRNRELKERFGVDLDWVRAEEDRLEGLCSLCTTPEPLQSSQTDRPRSLAPMKREGCARIQLVCSTCQILINKVSTQWAYQYLRWWNDFSDSPVESEGSMPEGDSLLLGRPAGDGTVPSPWSVQ